MGRRISSVADPAASLLDEEVVTAVLARHFPAASPEVLRHAAEDILLLEMLMRDEGIVWEDAMTEDPDPTTALPAPRPAYRRR